mmetsp:Transcript_9311/g.31136  ORF Transcript_9311/g.31136 Transcript_9311/m.31136 type:complete len:124 (-) Transcript_9311:368-739(-)
MDLCASAYSASDLFLLPPHLPSDVLRKLVSKHPQSLLCQRHVSRQQLISPPMDSQQLRDQGDEQEPSGTAARRAPRQVNAHKRQHDEPELGSSSRISRRRGEGGRGRKKRRKKEVREEPEASH